MGDGLPVVVMGVINVSPESFHAGSVHRDADVLATALAMVDAGASLIDVGARVGHPVRAGFDRRHRALAAQRRPRGLHRHVAVD